MLAKSFRVRAMDAVERLYNPSVPIFGAPANGMMAAQSLDSGEVERLVNRLEKASHRQTRAILLASLFVVSGMITPDREWATPIGPACSGRAEPDGVLPVLGLDALNIWWSERGHRS
jgi:ubiquinone biosynthesis protein